MRQKSRGKREVTLKMEIQLFLMTVTPLSHPLSYVLRSFYPKPKVCLQIVVRQGSLRGYDLFLCLSIILKYYIN